MNKEDIKVGDSFWIIDSDDKEVVKTKIIEIYHGILNRPIYVTSAVEEPLLYDRLYDSKEDAITELLNRLVNKKLLLDIKIRSVYDDMIEAGLQQSKDEKCEDCPKVPMCTRKNEEVTHPICLDVRVTAWKRFKFDKKYKNEVIKAIKKGKITSEQSAFDFLLGSCIEFDSDIMYETVGDYELCDDKYHTVELRYDDKIVGNKESCEESGR